MNRSDSARVAHMRRRLTAHYVRADSETLEAGTAWYRQATIAAGVIASRTDLTLRQTAGIIAALSPLNRWSTNIASATRVARAAADGDSKPPAVGLKRNVAKAWDIARDAHTDPLEYLSGPKVTRFYRNITGDLSTVTVDVWMLRAAETSNRVAKRTAPTAKQYRLIEEATRQAAALQGTTPAEFQAVVWTVVRGSAI